jgi:hypothetical protein
MQADLPDETLMYSSSMSMDEMQEAKMAGSFKSSSNDTGSATKKRKRGSNASEVAIAIGDFGNA